MSPSESSTLARRRPTFLPFAAPHITQLEIDEVVDSLQSGWLTTGPKTKRFEREFAEVVGTPHAIAVNSATAAMHLALDALGVGPDDEVIVPTYTFTATAEVVTYRQATPVLVDVDPVTCNLDPARLEAAITGRTRAVIPVHIAGLPVEMDDIRAVIDGKNISIVEDAAHAFPAAYKGRMVGTLGDLAAFSFYATKALCTGEGGMITTANPAYAERMSRMALHGISHDAWKRYTAEGTWYYEVLDAGYKYNMTDVAASLGLHQLARRSWLLERRIAIAAAYTSAFSDFPELETPPDPPHIQHAWHLYMLRLHSDRLSISREDFIKALMQANIGVSVHFIPLHLHPYYRNRFGYAPSDFPQALHAYEREISLPIYPGMQDNDVEDVVSAVTSIVRQYRR